MLAPTRVVGVAGADVELDVVEAGAVVVGAGAAEIVSTKEAVSEPVEFVAVTVYVVGPWATVGVPEIRPVVVSKVKPAERDGEMAYEDTEPPALEMEYKEPTALPTVAEPDDAERLMSGAATFTVRAKVAVSVWPPLTAVMV